MTIAILWMVLLVTSAGGTSNPVIGLFPDPSAVECTLDGSGTGILSIYVVVLWSPGLTALRFSAPLPTCLPGATHLSDTFMFPITTGNSQDGVAISFGTCVSSPIHVLTINVMVQGLSQPCCPYHILPHPGASNGVIEFMDCSGEMISGYNSPAFITSDGQWQAPILSGPDPPHGADKVPVNIDLSWDVVLCSCGLGVYWNDIYFGTIPDPPLVAQTEAPMWNPGTLSPKTIYYWKIVAVDTDGGTTTGPVWMFMTGGGIPAEPSTWGRIKGLYE